MGCKIGWDLEWNGIPSLVVGVDSTQMNLFGEHEASLIHFAFEHFVLGALQIPFVFPLFWGPYKIPFVFPPPPFERMTFGMECVPRDEQPS